MGHHFVKLSNKVNQKIAPWILGNMVRLNFGIGRKENLFIGHLHYLGILGKNVFCGTLNYKFMPFADSLGYVTVLHKDFSAVKNGINLKHVNPIRYS